MKCIKCGKTADKRYSPDLDIRGIGMCNNHADEIKADLIIANFEGFDRFVKKYKTK